MIPDVIADLRNRFVGRKDRIDGWRVLRAPFGPLVGDCDDFAVTALWLTEGKSMRAFWRAVLSKHAKFYYATTADGQEHLVLYHKGYGWIDNYYPTWDTMQRHSLRKVARPYVVAFKMVMGWF